MNLNTIISLPWSPRPTTKHLKQNVKHYFFFFFVCKFLASRDLQIQKHKNLDPSKFSASRDLKSGRGLMYGASHG
jgi:hypothetical protein